MPTKVAMEYAKMRNEKAMNDDRIAQSEKESKRRLVGDIVGSVLGVAGKAVPTTKFSHSVKASFKGKKNDGSWYFRYPELKDVNTSVPTFVPSNSAITKNDSRRFPAVMAIYYEQNWDGNFQDMQGSTNPSEIAINAMNISAQRFQAELRKFNSRIGEYNPGDLMQVTLASISIYILLAVVKRAIKTYYKFTPYQPKIAQTLLKAQGFDPDDFGAHIKDYEKWLSVKTQEANYFLAIPRHFSYIDRQMFLASVAYYDDKCDNSQIFIPVPLSFYKYNEEDAELNCIDIATYSDNRHGYLFENDIKPMYDDMLSAIQNSSVISTMLADIRGASGLELMQFNCDDMKEEINLNPVDEVLSQIMNSNSAPLYALTANTSIIPYYQHDNSNPIQEINDRFQLDGRDLVQNTDGFLYTSAGHGSLRGLTLHYTIQTPSDVSFSSNFEDSHNRFHPINNERTLNFFHNDVTKEDIVVSTRLLSQWKCFTSSTPISTGYVVNIDFTVAHAGTEVVIAYAIFECNAANLDSTKFSTYQYPEFVANTDVTQQYKWDIFAFNYYPSLYIPKLYNVEDQITWAESAYLVQQWSKVIRVTNDTLYYINDMCIKSEFYIAPPTGMNIK